MLAAQDIEAFHNDGFIIKRALLGPDEARALAAMTDEIAAWPERPGKAMMCFESSLARSGERLLSRIENFFPYHAGFREFLSGEAMLGGAAQLFGEPAVLFKDKVNFKLPGASGFTPHQDMQAGWDKYASLHITAMVTIDPATVENGCLEIVAGHHRRGLIGRMWAPLDDADTEGMRFEPCLCAPGDVVFFDSYTPHRSGPNLSGDPRRVLYITYNRLSEAITGASITQTNARVIRPIASGFQASNTGSRSDATRAAGVADLSRAAAIRQQQMFGKWHERKCQPDRDSTNNQRTKNHARPNASSA